MRILLLLLLPFFIADVVSAESLVIKGAGPSSQVVKEFLPLIGGGDAPFISIKHKGGLSWSDTHLFGRTGRPCTEEELQGRAEIFLAKVPMAFGVSAELNIESLSLAQLRSIYEGRIIGWQEIREGKSIPIITIGRESSESMYSALKQEYPFFDADQNPSLHFDRVRTKDDQVVKSILSGMLVKKGFIGFGALPNFHAAGITVLEVKDMKQIGVPLGLVYNLKNADDPLVARAREQARSPAWKTKVVELGMIPIE